jgi:uncharacterized membrane protein YfcA
VSPALVSVLIGVAAGGIAALCGLGGGIIMVPAFVLLLGLPQKSAVATSLVAVVLAALAASLKNNANGFIRWDIALPAGLAAALVAWLAADVLKHLENATLTRIFAILLIVVGVRMLWMK